jgi:L-asparaginase/Glu-tRNA(Gln) amidotransferase subunit D
VPRVPALVGRGWLAADDLQPWKARVLLRLGLAAGTTDIAGLQALFDAS